MPSTHYFICSVNYILSDTAILQLFLFCNWYSSVNPPALAPVRIPRPGSKEKYYFAFFSSARGEDDPKRIIRRRQKSKMKKWLTLMARRKTHVHRFATEILFANYVADREQLVAGADWKQFTGNFAPRIAYAAGKRNAKCADLEASRKDISNFNTCCLRKVFFCFFSFRREGLRTRIIFNGIIHV